MTFTKEWLQQKISEMESRRDDPWLGLDEDESNTLEALKLALSSLEAEPVAWLLSGGGVKNNVSFDSGNAYADPLREVTPLYTAPPAPVSMKDHQIRELVNELRDIAVEYHGTQQLRERIARTVRAAMLQGADGTLTNEGTRNHPEDNLDMVDHSGDANEKGNSPVIPEGWVACTERMPDKLIPVMEFTEGQLTHIIESANEVITALAGTNEEVHPDDSAKMCAAWDHLNDEAAPPAVVKRLAEIALVERAELVAYRALEERLEAMLRPDCPGFEAVCRALWDLEPHRLLAHAGYAVDYDSQPTAVKATIKRKVFTILRATAKEVRGEG